RSREPLRLRSQLGLRDRRQGPRGLAEVQGVEPEVDECTYLDIRILRRPPEIGALAIELDGSPEIAKLLMQPSQRILQARRDKEVVPVSGLGQTVVDDGERLAILPQPDVGEADEREREELLKAVVDLGRRTLGVTAENEGSAEVPPPVRVRPEPRLILGDRVLEPSRRRDARASASISSRSAIASEYHVSSNHTWLRRRWISIS